MDEARPRRQLAVLAATVCIAAMLLQLQVCAQSGSIPPATNKTGQEAAANKTEPCPIHTATVQPLNSSRTELCVNTTSLQDSNGTEPTTINATLQPNTTNTTNVNATNTTTPQTTPTNSPVSGGSSSTRLCNKFYHKYSVSFSGGCTGEYVVASCNGSCYTSQKPLLFQSRNQAHLAVDAFKTMCNCCSVTSWNITGSPVNLRCPDNVPRTGFVVTFNATNCGCSSCYSS